jgi:four helix bundle protein
LEQEVTGPGRQVYSYRNLALWQRAQELALGVIKMSESLPKSEAARSIARQVVSSSGSVAANIAEGHGRYSVAAYRNHLSIARGSTAETDSWLDLLARAGMLCCSIAPVLGTCRGLLFLTVPKGNAHAAA